MKTTRSLMGKILWKNKGGECLYRGTDSNWGQPDLSGGQCSVTENFKEQKQICGSFRTRSFENFRFHLTWDVSKNSLRINMSFLRW